MVIGISIAVIVILALLYFFRSFLVVAFVNGQPISRWSLDRQLEKTAGKQILNNKIAEILVAQEAQKQKIVISQSEIDTAVKELEDSFKAQGQTLDAVLAMQGQSKEEFLKQMNLQLLLEKMLGSDIQITDEEVAEYFTQNKDYFAEGATLENQKEQIKKNIFDQKLTEKISPWLTELQNNAKIIYFLNL
jgi:foldase protein PrsA